MSTACQAKTTDKADFHRKNARENRLYFFCGSNMTVILYKTETQKSVEYHETKIRVCHAVDMPEQE